jgi:hypothetical protein
MKSRQVLRGRGNLKPRCLFPEQSKDKSNLVRDADLKTHRESAVEFEKRPVRVCEAHFLPEYYQRVQHKKPPVKRLSKQRAILRLQEHYWKK